MGWYRDANASLKGLPDRTLTIVLLVAAVVLVAVALHGDPVVKGVVAAWVVFP